ncbi:hypothetical protein COCCADRAFT_100868 [Bipolaris zeicola 26-R-13]|uniref:N-acetyltransferase domain-containing protein n=1 Tax=Cochliobolus carbonum (strain 26-R-13) TaxID=930089 RepID=W6Y8A2_COCC2|nr:uncharacterized protein COCCADRAFT_100868 [Bipolaris zeicola 26-R-13]EUC31599.1 hypothetical protein COCCADRAFT_100868 [Bipolaris zeicola 26-R-13]
MKLNENECILTPRLLLVPYCSHHVLTYHQWMQDEDLQKLTASEPLTLPEEYSMQESWRQDADKLTFVICTASDHSAWAEKKQVIPGLQDAPECMIGDVNLFLYPYDDDDEDNVQNEEKKNSEDFVVGELEIMIAQPSARGKGLAHEALQAFMWYISSSLPSLLAEYTQQDKQRRASLRYLRVKIDKDNKRSLALFEKLGFKHSTGPNYFGELELRANMLNGGVNMENVEKLVYGSS